MNRKANYLYLSTEFILSPNILTTAAYLKTNECYFLLNEIFCHINMNVTLKSEWKVSSWREIPFLPKWILPFGTYGW